jgi:hypothetical protein
MDENQLLLIKLAHTKMPFGKYEEIFWLIYGILCSVVLQQRVSKRPTGRAVKTNLRVKTERTRDLIRNIKNIKTSLK